MKVVHLNTLSRGGAAIAALRLHRGLLNAGVQSSMLSTEGTSTPEPGIYSLKDRVTDGDSIARRESRRKYLEAWKVRWYGKPVELFSFPYSRWKPEEDPLVKEADIVHLHWVAGMFDVRRFFGACKKPLVWTLHDAWPFTGGFHYENYFDAKPFGSLSERLLKYKEEAYGRRNMTLISPSLWMLQYARESRFFAAADFEQIENGFPQDIFTQEQDRLLTRKKLGIEDHQQMWFFSSAELDYYRKGADLLLDAFSRYDNPHVRLVMAGAEENSPSYGDGRIIRCGVVSTEQEMSRLYAAADATLHPSREDNLPNSIAESLLCGTPVYATAVGGVPEMIENDVNGWLSNTATADDFLKGFSIIRNMASQRNKIAQNARERFNAEKQVKEILKVYSDHLR